MAASTASPRSTSAWPTAADSTSSRTSWASPIARSSTSSPAARPTRPMSAARATSNITSAPRRTASSTATRCICRCFPTRRTSKRSIRSCWARRARSRRCGRQARQDGPADAAPRRRRLRRPGRGVRMPRLLRPARIRHRRHDPLHHQQPGRLHDQPAVRALLALSVGRRQGRPGADPARQRRRSGSGDLLLQAGDRVPPDLRPRRRDRHVVLPPVRPQRGRRAELHAAADVRGDPQAPADQPKFTASG